MDPTVKVLRTIHSTLSDNFRKSETVGLERELLKKKTLKQMETLSRVIEDMELEINRRNK